MFPSLLYWSQPNVHRIRSPTTMDKQRRVCSPKHFDTYFRFVLSNDVLSMSEINNFIARSGDLEFVRQAFRQAAKIARPTGDTRAALFLEALITHADDVPEENIVSLLKAVYSVANDLVGQQERGLDAGTPGTTTGNLLDLHDALTLRYAALEDKPAVLLEACKGAALGCLVFIAREAYREHDPSGNESPRTPGKTLTTREYTDKLKELAVKHIRKAAADGSLINCPLLDGVLLWWEDMTGSDEAARAWVSDTIRDDHAVARLARAFTGVPRTISRSSDVARTEPLRRVVDWTNFEYAWSALWKGSAWSLRTAKPWRHFGMPGNDKKRAAQIANSLHSAIRLSCG